MNGSFVWFDLRTTDQGRSREFYEQLLGWEFESANGGPTMVKGQEGPWAHLENAPGSGSFWLPYTQVDDVAAATRKAVELGATVRAERVEGPGGIYSVVADPTGAELALWQPPAA